MKSTVHSLSDYKTWVNKWKGFYSLWMFPLITEWQTAAFSDQLLCLTGVLLGTEERINKNKNKQNVQMEAAFQNMSQ